MTWGDFSAKNVEVYTSAFNRGNDKMKSRENLGQVEKLKRIDSVESLEENFKQIEEVAKNNLEEAKVMAKSFLLKQEYFAKVAGINPVILNFITAEADKLFKNYFSSLEAANEKMKELLTFKSEINEEIQAAQTPEEFKDLQSIKKSKTAQIMQSYNGMSNLYHLAEKKIESIFNEYFPRKNNLPT